MTNSPLNVSSLGRLSQEVFADAWERAPMPPPCPDISSGKARQAAFAVIQQAPDQVFQRLTDLFRWTADLSEDRGINAIRLAAGETLEELNRVFGGLKSSQDRSMWTILNHPDVAARADRILSGDKLKNGGVRYVNLFQALEAPDLQSQDLSFSAFEAALRNVYSERGEPVDRLKIESIGRAAIDVGGERVIQIMIRRALQAEVQSDWSNLEITELRYRPVSDTFLYFWPMSGRLDVLAERGGRTLRDSLAAAFATTVLKQQPPDKIDPIDVDLSSLIEQRSFPTAPDDGIQSVHVVRLKAATRAGYAVTLETLGGTSIWDRDDACQLVRAAPFAPLRAELEFAFAPPRRGEAQTTRRVRLSTPNGTSFPRATPAQKATMERYLDTWGLTRAPFAPAQRAA